MSPMINSELSLEFVVIFPKFGVLFVSGTLLLDARQLFTFKTNQVSTGFNNRFQLKFSLMRDSEKDIQ